MNCHSCSRKTLSIFIRSITSTEFSHIPHLTVSQSSQAPRAFSSAAHSQYQDDRTTSSRNDRPSSQRWERSSSPREYRPYASRRDQFPSSGRDQFPSSGRDQFPSSGRDQFSSSGRDQYPSSRRDRNSSSTSNWHTSSGQRSFAARKPVEERITWRKNTMRGVEESEEPREKPYWQIQKAALKEKLNGETWNPRKKLSPDTQEGIRHLHQTHPGKFSTAVLSDHFRISPEAIRRILKSKWRPSDEEQDDRLARWDKRGEKIWSNMVELGLKPPKRWREMGVGSARDGQAPRWKWGSRNTVPMNDSVSEDLIPTVYSNAKDSRPSKEQQIPLFERIP